MSESPTATLPASALRVLSPYLRLASKRWRAGKTFQQIAASFPARLGVNRLNLLELVAAVRRHPQASPTWDFPEGRDANPPSEEWIVQHADEDDLPRNWVPILQRQDLKVYAREHQRAQLGDIGRPCIHEPYENVLDASTNCARCGLELSPPQRDVPKLVAQFLGKK